MNYLTVRQIHPQKTRIVHVRLGFEFLGYLIKYGRRRQSFSRERGRNAPSGSPYVYPTEKSIRRFKERVRQLTSRRAPVTTEEMIEEINPTLRGWGHYYQKAHVRRLFTQLDAWIVRRLWAHRCKRWRCSGWKQLPQSLLYGELKLVSLLQLHLRVRPPGRAPS